MNLEEFLEQKAWSCAYLTPSPSRRVAILHCIARKVANNKVVLLVTDISVIKLMISTWKKVIYFKSAERRRGSKTEFTLSKTQVECENFRNVPKINPRVYPELSKVEKIGLENESCWLMIPHGSLHHRSCSMYLKSFYSIRLRLVWSQHHDQHL